MKTETVEYKDGDVTLRGYLAYDDKKTGKRPGVLVMPEAFGLGEHAKKRAERLAELGYVAFAGDPYGNGVEVASLPEAMKLATPLFTDPSKLRKRGRAALDHLASVASDRRKPISRDRLLHGRYVLAGTRSRRRTA